MQRFHTRRRTAVAALACLIGAQASAAFAATADTAVGALDEIVVTATRRAENLQIVPLTVSVVSQQMLQAQNLMDTADLTQLVPDLTFLPGINPGASVFGIRGITTLSTNGQGLEQSAGVAFDGVPLARPTGSVSDLVDVHSVEVLKGPQGMLFGKNASAGLINIVTNSPDIGKDASDFRVTYGTLNLKTYTGTVNLRVTDQSALRLSAWHFGHDGSVKEVVTDKDMNDKNSNGARVKYRWRPSDALDLNLTAEWDNHQQNGTGYTIRFFDPANFGPQGGLIQTSELANGTTPSDSNRSSRGRNMPYYDNGNTQAYTGQADYSVGGGTLTSIVAYRDIYNTDQDNRYPTDSPVNGFFKNLNTTHYNQLSEEVRFASPTDQRIRFVAGLFNFRLNLFEGIGVGNAIFGAPVTINIDYGKNIKNDSYAAFGEATFDITPQLHLIAGLRRSTDKLDATMNRTANNSIPIFLQPFLNPSFGPLTDSLSATYNDISWRTGLQYDISPEAMAYVTVSRGYKGPAVGWSFSETQAQLRASNNGYVKPEIAHDVEAGIKTQWFDRRLTVNAAAYNETLDDFQTSIVVPGQTVAFYIANAPQAMSTGLDLDATWAVTHEFSLRASATYDHARYTHFENAPCYTGQVAGCVNSAQNLDGKALPGTPKVSTNLTARYERPLGASLIGFVQANHTYRSSVIYDTTDDPNTRQGGYGLLNSTLGVTTADGHWGVAIYGNNILDKHHVDTIAYSPNAYFYMNYISYQDLQTFGITVNARF
ncbi:MAG: TonB-dependent receptor [Pseudomonadota bacterium]|nr:TonB-dependent receptor [Pseudomonadota bacterium]